MTDVKMHRWNGSSWVQINPVPAKHSHNWNEIDDPYRFKTAYLDTGNELALIFGRDDYDDEYYVDLSSLRADPGLLLVRERVANQLSTASGAITLDIDVPVGATLLIEVATTGSISYNPKLITVTVGKSTTSSTTNANFIASWQTWNGSNLRTNSFVVSRSGYKQLYFTDCKYIEGTFSGSNISWVTGTQTLYVGRIWRLDN